MTYWITRRNMSITVDIPLNIWSTYHRFENLKKFIDVDRSNLGPLKKWKILRENGVYIFPVFNSVKNYSIVYYFQSYTIFTNPNPE
jgi:hypothetical protein